MTAQPKIIASFNQTRWSALLFSLFTSYFLLLFSIFSKLFSLLLKSFFLLDFLLPFFSFIFIIFFFKYFSSTLRTILVLFITRLNFTSCTFGWYFSKLLLNGHLLHILVWRLGLEAICWSHALNTIWVTSRLILLLTAVTYPFIIVILILPLIYFCLVFWILVALYKRIHDIFNIFLLLVILLYLFIQIWLLAFYKQFFQRVSFNIIFTFQHAFGTLCIKFI